MALRMKKVLAKEQPSSVPMHPSTEEAMAVYDQEAGFIIYWDFVLDLVTTCSKLTVTYALFDGMIQRTPYKTIRARECEADGGGG